jgi:hypothetical protein
MHHWRTVGRVIPWSGCSPAEPASVSPGSPTVTKATGADKAEKQSLKVRISVGVPDRCYSRKILTPQVGNRCSNTARPDGMR